MEMYIVRYHSDEEFINGEFNQRSLLGFFKANDYLELFNIINEAIDPYELSFVEMPNSTGVFFTQGEIEFESNVDATTQFKLDQVAFELSENLLQTLNEGIEWKVWVDETPITWRSIRQPNLLN